jgi:hypothetical protein
MTNKVPVRTQDFALDTTSPTTTSLSALTAAMQKVSAMEPDDLSLEIDAPPDRLRVRLRAYRHRETSGAGGEGEKV